MHDNETEQFDKSENQEEEMYSIRIETINGRQDVVINKNLTINNIIASLQLEMSKGQVLTYEDQPLKGGEIIKDTLKNKSTIII